MAYTKETIQYAFKQIEGIMNDVEGKEHREVLYTVYEKLGDWTVANRNFYWLRLYIGQNWQDAGIWLERHIVWPMTHRILRHLKEGSPLARMVDWLFWRVWWDTISWFVFCVPRNLLCRDV